jgi:hypothetical protein
VKNPEKQPLETTVPNLVPMGLCGARIPHKPHVWFNQKGLARWCEGLDNA